MEDKIHAMLIEWEERLAICKKGNAIAARAFARAEVQSEQQKWARKITKYSTSTVLCELTIADLKSLLS